MHWVLGYYYKQGISTLVEWSLILKKPVLEFFSIFRDIMKSFTKKNPFPFNRGRNKSVKSRGVPKKYLTLKAGKPVFAHYGKQNWTRSGMQWEQSSLKYQDSVII